MANYSSQQRQRRRSSPGGAQPPAAPIGAGGSAAHRLRPKVKGAPRSVRGREQRWSKAVLACPRPANARTEQPRAPSSASLCILTAVCLLLGAGPGQRRELYQVLEGVGVWEALAAAGCTGAAGRVLRGDSSDYTLPEGALHGCNTGPQGPRVTEC